MDRNDDATEKHRPGGWIGSRQGQKEAAFGRCGGHGGCFAKVWSGLAALRHRCVNQPDFSHP